MAYVILFQGVACLPAGRYVRPSLTAHTASRYYGAPSANALALPAGPVVWLLWAVFCFLPLSLSLFRHLQKLP